MKAKKIEVLVEKAEDGTYWGTTQNYEGVVSAFGSSMEEMQRSLGEAFKDNVEITSEENPKFAMKYANVEFEYKMNLSSFFNLVSELKISSIAEKANLNPSLVRQYKNGLATASQEQAKKIQEAVHSLGRELLSVRF